MNLVNIWHKKSVVQTFVLYPYVIIDSTSYRYFMRYTDCSVLLLFVLLWLHHHNFMMTSSNGNIFRVTGHMCGEFTGHLWIPRTKASDAELWCFFFICDWINGWVNNCEAGDLRRYPTHYDVIVMFMSGLLHWNCVTLMINLVPMK